VISDVCIIQAIEIKYFLKYTYIKYIKLSFMNNSYKKLFYEQHRKM
jgi:hypothetical protein